MTLFGGPNGSGKSTIIRYIRANELYPDSAEAYYLNADDLEQHLKRKPHCVTTRDADINVARVWSRVQQNGHSVAEAKIRSRYINSLENLADALRVADEAYLFDNSTDGAEGIEVARKIGPELTVLVDEVPAWYITYVENKFI